MFKHEKLNLLIFIVLLLLQLLGVVGLLTRFHPFYLFIIIPLFFWGGISTTLYLHRYLTHRGFEMPEWLKFILATGSAVVLAGDPVTWVGDHRYHHLKSDTDASIPPIIAETISGSAFLDSARAITTIIMPNRVARHMDSAGGSLISPATSSGRSRSVALPGKWSGLRGKPKLRRILRLTA